MVVRVWTSSLRLQGEVLSGEVSNLLDRLGLLLFQVSIQIFISRVWTLIPSGYLSDYKHIPKHILEEDIAKLILYSAANVRGVFPCNKNEYKRMIRALEIGGVKPIIDKVSPIRLVSSVREISC